MNMLSLRQKKTNSTINPNNVRLTFISPVYQKIISLLYQVNAQTVQWQEGGDRIDPGTNEFKQMPREIKLT